MPPGLYAIGQATTNAPLIVSCNYKLTLDLLRRDLEGLNVLVLILDTKGINVWCAAGKGTFSTRELLYQLNRYEINTKFSCEKIILPQLGAASMELHIVKKYFGLDLIYGPVRSNDLKDFINNGYTATKIMRKVTFNLFDRLPLIPLEFILSLKFLFVGFIFFLLLNKINNSSTIFIDSLYNSLILLIANSIGTILVPLLLPYLPGRAFYKKGLVLSLPMSLILFNYFDFFRFDFSLMGQLAIIIIFNLLIMWESFLFTGSTTFTSLSGVSMESKILEKISIFLSFIVIILVIIEVI